MRLRDGHKPAGYVREALICHGCAKRDGRTCTANGQPYVLNAKEKKCPLGLFAIQRRPSARSESRGGCGGAGDPMGGRGPAMWAELHRLPLSFTTPAVAARELAEFTSRLPCGVCKAGFKELLGQMPPNLGSAAGLARWAVDVHNRVNADLKKPEIAWDEAREIWNYPPQFDPPKAQTSPSVADNGPAVDSVGAPTP